ncbi:hypothetical protein CspHIS471_0209780 [Cutaneotrichosporon sp. HIS471]|nr:hypothetical protein CspHIS471_0209780 [Cutaneotrichosporon sp. HIS471]
MGQLQRKIETFFWGTPPASAKERKLLRKLDMVILSYICLSYWINYLDRANLANAYATGMRQAVGFKGNDYTMAQACFTAGYVVGQVPGALILASGRISPRFWFPFCVCAWGFCTLGLAFVKNPHSVMAIRFVMAIFEASTFSGSHYILGSWYKDEELGKRTAVFTSAAQFGTMFSGIMQGAIRQTMEGRNGLAGWQWMMIINFAMTIPIGVYGFVMFPGTPQTVNSFWLTEEERELCLSRLPPHEHYVVTWPRFKKSILTIVSTWRYYLFSALFMVSATSFEKTGIYNEFMFWLEDAGYPKHLVNYYPCIYTAVAIVGTYIMTVYCDATGHRFIANVIMFVSVLISSIMLLIWYLPTGAHFFAYIIGAIGYAGQASNFAWANSLTRDDEMLRSVTLFSMNLFSNLWNLWYQIAVWPIVDRPRFRKGQIATIVTGFVAVGIAGAIAWCSRRFKPDLPQTREDEMDGEADGDAPSYTEKGGVEYTTTVKPTY